MMKLLTSPTMIKVIFSSLRRTILTWDQTIKMIIGNSGDHVVRFKKMLNQNMKNLLRNMMRC
jgi:hypothetical protein